ncbi:MAG: hypothetical protein WCX16_01660 [Candidatus Omnitrophota bacterium]
MIKDILFFMLLFSLCAPSHVFAGSAQDAAFLSSINNQGEGATFDRAILLSDTADYSSCETFECAEKVFNETVFKDEIKYVAGQFGQPQSQWELLGQGEVTAYVFGNSRYYDDLSIQEVATGKRHVFHFDITSSVDGLKKEEYSIDSSAASYKWERGFFY